MAVSSGFADPHVLTDVRIVGISCGVGQDVKQEECHPLR